MQELDVASRKITAIKELSGGTRHIASLLAFGQDLLPSWIAAFNAQHPEIRIVVRTGHSDYIEEEVQAGRVDLGLSLLPPTVPDVHHQALITDQAAAVVSKSHPLASRQNITVTELSNTTLALIGPGSAARRLIDSVFAARKLSPDIDDLEALIDITRLGRAATLAGPDRDRTSTGINKARKIYCIMCTSGSFL